MIVDKFNKDFAKGNKNISKIIEDQVTEYFSKEKVTEDSLRTLKQKVAKAVEDYRKDSKSGKISLIQKKASSQSPPSRISSKGTQRRSEAKHLHNDWRRKISNRRRSNPSDPDSPQRLAQWLPSQSIR